MGKKGFLGFGLMAIASIILIVVIIVLVLVALNMDAFKSGGKGVLQSESEVSLDYMLLSLLKTPVDKNLNIGDLVSLSFDDPESFERLENEIHSLFEDSDFYYSFYYRKERSPSIEFTKPGWVGVYEEGTFKAFDVLDPKNLGKNMGAMIIPSPNAKDITVTLKILEGRPE
ncbi:MAG: hypothetical protein ABIB47_05840 [Candidatus Woesearchaeota archaeon]